MATISKGNCYVCGRVFGKTAIKNHLQITHAQPDGDQKCFLLKIEDAYLKNYWLYADISLTASLSSLDKFLREIWLECCGHLSAFLRNGGPQIGKTRKLGELEVGESLLHEYDFGTTSATVISIVAETKRKTQKKAVRLLARNEPPVFRCITCGAPATSLCAECMCETDDAFFCDACGQAHEHEDMLLPVVNSPRMGMCGYCGEFDTYAFNPDAIK